MQDPNEKENEAKVQDQTQYEPIVMNGEQQEQEEEEDGE